MQLQLSAHIAKAKYSADQITHAELGIASRTIHKSYDLEKTIQCPMALFPAASLSLSFPSSLLALLSFLLLRRPLALTSENPSQLCRGTLACLGICGWYTHCLE